MLADDCVVLKIQMLAGSDLCEIVMGLGDVESLVSPSTSCQSAVETFIELGLSPLLACLSPDTSVIGVEAHGLVPGHIPYRVNFPVGTQPGTSEGTVMPANVSAIVHFYEDVDSMSPGNPLKPSRNSIPGLSEDDVVTKFLVSTLVDSLEAYAQTLVDGMAASSGPAALWKRIMTAAVQETAAEVAVCVAKSVSAVVGSVRRRLKP